MLFDLRGPISHEFNEFVQRVDHIIAEIMTQVKLRIA